MRLFILLSLSVSSLMAHRYHTSLTVIEHNPKAQTAEITLRLLAEDLEVVLTREMGDDQQLEVNPAIEKATFAYLKQHFKLRQNGRELELRWIGMEFEAEAAYVYVEASINEGFTDLALYHQVFCELANEQINTVNFKDATGVHTQTHKRGHDFKPIKNPG